VTKDPQEKRSFPLDTQGKEEKKIQNSKERVSNLRDRGQWRIVFELLI